MVFHHSDSSSEYVSAFPVNEKTAKQKKMWYWIAGIVVAIIVIVVAIAVAVVVTDKQKNQDDSSPAGNTSQYPVSPYAHMTTIVTNNDTALQQKERILVVGDVHGCVKEFNALLTQLNFNSTTDQIILAGDLTAKGPDSTGVIRLAKQIGALCVRGNHDDKVIRLRTFENEEGESKMQPPSATMPEGNVPDPLKFDNHHVDIAENLTSDDYAYLSSCPVMLHLPFLNNSVVVHGGLDPSVSSLQDQVPYLVMNMRDIDNSTSQPTPDTDNGVQWSYAWDTFQRSLTLDNTQIFYGHDAGRGLNLRNYTFGVDTGCVYGDDLTAIDVRTKELTQVKCKSYADRGS